MTCDNAVTAEQIDAFKEDMDYVREFSDSAALTATTPDGQPQLTITGIISKGEDAIDTIGYTFLDPATFETGVTITDPNEALLWATIDGGNGEYYRWAGALPKTVSAGSTPASTGGVGESAWRALGSAVLRDQLAEPDSDVLVGGVKAGSLYLTINSDSALSSIDASSRVFVTSKNSSNNVSTFYRRQDLDNPAKAGSPAEVLGSTLFLWDSVGSAFVEHKQAIPKRDRSEGKLAGRNVHIYEWGSPFGGNDFCFVRTPDNYQPSDTPHPFVILNHGNGWVMDGTESKANFSDKTQFGVDTQNGGTYLDTGRADYVEFSSPLIEALLAQGYVVCGAQNDGQNYGGGSAGYGNRETRQNIKLFYDHMQQNYNVEKWCHMIAASNGSIATLNAAQIMGRDRIRSITLLYPLINLHAAWSSTYESQVSQAYGNFTPSSFSAFRAATESHDPMVSNCDYSIRVDESAEAVYANANFYRLNQDAGTKDLFWLRENRLVDSTQASETSIALTQVSIYRRANFPYPRVRCHWSPDDTVVPQEFHWEAFQKLLDRGNHVFASEEVLGQHGDYRHFEGLDGNGVSRIISWMEI